MARIRSYRDLLSARAVLMVIALLASLLGMPSEGQEKDRVPFRLSGAARKPAESPKPLIEVTSNESDEEEKGESDEVAEASESNETSGVITGEVSEQKEPADPADGAEPKESRDYFRMQNLLPAPRVGKTRPTGSAADGEITARANFRLSARKPDSDGSGRSIAEEAATMRALMGPPDPSAIGLEIDGRVPPDAAHSVTGARSLGRAISAYKSGGAVQLPGEGLELPAGDGLPGIEDGGETLFSNWLPGQQGTPFSAADAAEPVPGTSTRVETFADTGYFPTRDDSFYIGDLDYPRGRLAFGGGGIGAGIGPGGATYRGPDLRSQAWTGIYPYENPDETFYDRYDFIFDPLDRSLGFFSPNNALVAESERLQGFNFGMDGNLPIVTQQFNPDRAMFKAGPFYMDILSLGAGALYSDFRAGNSYPDYFDDGEEDGFISYIDVDVRALLQITNNFYLSAATRVMYLPGSDRVAFQLGYGTKPAVYLRLNYEAEWGPWDVLFYDEFRGQLGVDIFEEVGSGAIDRAGRYYFGIIDLNNRTYDFFDEGAMFWTNALVAKATRPLGQDWRLWLQGDHLDFWRGWNFEDHRRRDHLGAAIGYEGSRIPFAPYASWDTYTLDDFDSFYHVARLGARGRLTENLSLNASGGYLFTTSRDPDQDYWLWRVGLTHDLSERTRHGINGGQDFFLSDFSDDAIVADYVGYHFFHQISRTVSARAFAQWSQGDVVSDGDAKREMELYGAYLDFRPLDFTSVQAGAYYQETKYAEGGFEDDRWLYYGMLTQRVLSRTSVYFRYQFEDSNYFDEHVYSTGVRRYF